MPRLLTERDDCTDDLIDAIRSFQQGIPGVEADGRLMPQDHALGRLCDALPSDLTADKLCVLMPRGRRDSINRYLGYLKEKMPQAGLLTPLRVAHFLAQVAHECVDLTQMEEGSSGLAYEGSRSLGNTQRGDGPRFKGRGLLQLTGRWNYWAYGRSRLPRIDLTASGNERLVATNPEMAVDAACWYWNTLRKANSAADADDITRVTQLVNGGTNGLEDRRTQLARVKFVMRLT
ncbi:MAG: hypothetical protein MUF00_21185 [Gemmatimonadaceae bacterium]|jgi:putative chitinase|nr:hypothetical protein [Gemmatimonadaceae bacterium]